MRLDVVAGVGHHGPMSTMRGRNNNTQHVEVRFTDGEVFGEKHRDSFGGFCNMVRRIEARVGGEARSRDENGVVTFTAAGREFQFVNVEKL